MREIGSTSQIRWDDTPPGPSIPWIPIYRCPTGGELVLPLLGATVCGVWMHSVRKRDTPCLHKACPWIVEGVHLPLRRKWYFPCWCPGQCRMVLGEVPAKAWSDWLKGSARQVQPERGGKIHMRRFGEKENGPVAIEFIPLGTADPTALPEPFDVRAALERLWMGDDHPVEPV